MTDTGKNQTKDI